ncbi:MAG: hypothetical protein AB1733_02435 [Thermodesulfobacteriota bacterium]
MNSEPRLDIFVEDRAHEYFIRALVRRLAREQGLSFDVQVRSGTGGHGRAVSEFRNYQALLDKGLLSDPGLIVVAIDANCAKFPRKRREILDTVSSARSGAVIAACPDPHVERWYMADPESFHRVVGSSPRIRQKKCKRDYYKNALASAVRQGGHPPTLSGIEFAEELVAAMDLYKAGKIDRSLGLFVEELRSALRR